MFSNEEKSPRTPEANKLYHLVDDKSQKIAIIQTTLTKLKEEKNHVSVIINKHYEILVDVTRMHSKLLSYTTSKHGNLVHTTPELVMHHEYRTTEPLVLNLHPCPICNQMFHFCGYGFLQMYIPCIVLGFPHIDF
jgi:3-methyladenine DNA glycosylase AlkC